MRRVLVLLLGGTADQQAAEQDQQPGQPAAPATCAGRAGTESGTGGLELKKAQHRKRPQYEVVTKRTEDALSPRSEKSGSESREGRRFLFDVAFRSNRERRATARKGQFVRFPGGKALNPSRWNRLFYA